MNKPYDFLFTDLKIPFLFFEKAKIVMKDGFLVALNGDKGIETIPVAQVGMLFLGYGTSITQEAALFCSMHDCYVCFSRGGFNVHTCINEQRNKNPEKLLNQVDLVKNHKLEVAKELLKLRVMLDYKSNKYNHYVDEFNSLNQLRGHEGAYARKVYKRQSDFFNIKNFTRDQQYESKRFKKDKSPETVVEKINGRLNIVNNVLYNFCSILSLKMSLDPSLSFLHGDSRRSGLCYDLADVIKTKVTIPISFDLKKYNDEFKLMVHLRNKMVENNFKYIKLLVEICTQIGDGKVFNAEEIYLKFFDFEE